MNFDQLIQLHALKFKEGLSPGSGDSFTDRMLESNPEGSRQVCAMVSQVLFDELESKTAMLEISKRRFVEGALIDALDKVSRILNEIDVLEDVRTDPVLQEEKA